MTIQTLRASFRMFVACLLAASLMQALPARADDYTDIWWAGSTEDGWGVNFIQSQDFIFATFFVYGPAPAKTPIWYVGNMARQGNGTFSGGLFQTTGTGFGVPWNPIDHTVVQVGTATFNPIDSSSGTLDYSVNGVAVHKSIVRQTLTPIAIGGTYYGTAVVVHSGCSTAGNNGTVLTDFDPVVAQASGTLQFDFVYAGTENCTLSGAYAREGLLFRVPAATYVCLNGMTTTVSTTATIYEMKSTSIGLEGRWFAANVGGGCVEDAKFATVFP